MWCRRSNYSCCLRSPLEAEDTTLPFWRFQDGIAKFTYAPSLLWKDMSEHSPWWSISYLSLLLYEDRSGIILLHIEKNLCCRSVSTENYCSSVDKLQKQCLIFFFTSGYGRKRQWSGCQGMSRSREILNGSSNICILWEPKCGKVLASHESCWRIKEGSNVGL